MTLGLFEAIMMICFGSAWPFSIYKSYTSRSNKGKSLGFLIVVMIGYLSGITHKILHNLDYVIILYFVDLSLVAIDTILYFRNRGLEKNIIHRLENI